MREDSNFWSRRKAAVAAEEADEDRSARIAETEAEEAALEARSDEEILAAFDLPEPEALDSTEAVQAFLKSGVPQRLKTRALRRLWRLNPIFGNLDGLVDYGEDFTDSATVIENMQTVYQVGKGMFDKLEEKARQEELAKAKAEAAATEPEPEDTPDEEALAEAETDIAVESPEPAVAMAQLPEPDDVDFHTIAPRRMRFSFEAAT